jgi:hypothetical protein
VKSAALALVFVLVAVAGCSDAANTQLLPIGSRCSSNAQCGTPPYDCAATGYPYGYCEKPCTTNGDCPADSLCNPSPTVHACRRVCMSSSTCRTADGYSCQTLVGGQGVCEAGGTSMDGGTP